MLGGLRANPSGWRLECGTGRGKKEWMIKKLKREMQDVNNFEHEGQKAGKLRFLECLLHPGSFRIISLNTHVNPVSDGRILTSEKISYSGKFSFTEDHTSAHVSNGLPAFLPRRKIWASALPGGGINWGE